MKSLVCIALLCWLFTTVLYGEPQSLIHYVIPTVPSSEKASLCPANAVDHCSTLNEFSKRRTSRGQFQSNERVILRSGLHILNGSLSHRHLFASDIEFLEIRGEPNTTILCLKEFFFHFYETDSITIASIHFQNCTASESGKLHTTLYFISGSLVKLHNIIITNYVSSIGIVLDSVSDRVEVINTTIATKGTGIQSIGNVFGEPDWHPGKDLFDSLNKLIIVNTLFYDSCLEIHNKYVSCIVRNVTFEGCSCTVVKLSDRDQKGTILQDVQIANSKGPYLMFVSESSSFQIEGQCSFKNNSGAIVLYKSDIIFQSAHVDFADNTVLTNSVTPGTIIFATGYTQSSSISVIRSKLTFKNNTGQHSGGITLIMATLYLERGAMIVFINNHGDKGGALSFFRDSRMVVGNVNDKSDIMLSFVNNQALKGGAIYVEDRDYLTAFARNFTGSVVHVFNVSATKMFKGTFKLMFSNNTATIGGNNIYGGWIDWTSDRQGGVYYDPNVAETMEFNDNDDISSDPTRVCMCIDNIANCSVIEHPVEVIPGQTLTIKAVAVGQRFGSVVSVITATFNTIAGGESGRVRESQNVQIVQRTCTRLDYTIMSPNSIERIFIKPTESENSPVNLLTTKNYAILFQQFSILLKVKSCPLAFILDELEHQCICLPSTIKHNLRCDLTNYTVLRKEHQWVGMTYTNTIPEENPGIISHPNCPFDYCREDADSIHMEFQDQQCALNRSGNLCGECQTNLSHILGSSRCKKCSHLTLLAIIPIFIVAGLLLIVLLMVLNLTVSIGTINGLIFYANIIRALHSTYFTQDISTSFLSKFIAWLNLDLGVETCFYDGLDAYTKTWFQYMFPLYIWILVTIIIISSHYSTTASRLSGKNAVQVLATLFLLSYTKLLRLVITVFSSTTITYPNGYIRAVWLYDGNVDFLQGKHLLLFIVTLLLVIFLSVPYTLTLVSYQWLLKISHFRVMVWLRKLKPLFDAYTGPYKTHHRYWTGLLLIVRITVLVMVSLNRSNNPSINLLIVAVVMSALLLWLYFTRWVYESITNNCLEVLFLCNLSLTSTVILFELSIDKQSLTTTFTSTGVSFVIFLVILLYHTQRQLFLTRAGAKFKKRVIDIVCQKQSDETEGFQLDINQPNSELKKKVTSTVVELTQTLLQEDYN